MARRIEDGQLGWNVSSIFIFDGHTVPVSGITQQDSTDRKTGC
jgi:hypothetical protein